MSSQDEVGPDHENASDHSATSKFKKVFLKKRDSKDGQSSSGKHGEASSGYYKKAPYVSKFQKLRRKVRKTYPLLEIQENMLKASNESQHYASVASHEEVGNESVESDNSSEIFEVGRRNSPPQSAESSEAEVDDTADDDDTISYSYEASNSLPHPDVTESPAVEPYHQSPSTISTISAIESPTAVNEDEQEHESQKSYVYIDTSELFERPNLDAIGIQQNHLAPCLSRSENNDSEKKLNAQSIGKKCF